MTIKDISGHLKSNWKPYSAILLLGIVLGYSFAPSPSKTVNNKAVVKQAQRKVMHWTCSMHPQIKAANSGKCPICGMDLIPIYEEGDDDQAGGEVSLKLGKRAQRLAEVASQVIEYRPLTKEIYTVGKVDYDETRLAYVSAWIGGRIDKLYADFTGTQVNKDEHLVLLYSPELMSAQEEYFLALKNVRQSSGGQFSSMAKNTLLAAKEKLLLYGVTEKQLKEIKKRNKVQTHLTINAPISGTVIHKKALEGMYVKMGDPIYTIADLSNLWLYLDIYEYDLAWIKYGQMVGVTTEAYPGEKFSGRIVFIDPVLNERTRTIRVRVNISNKEGKLKPGMYANASIKVKVGAKGQVQMADLAGKYIGSMHPEIIRDKPGKCPICGMNLVPAGGIIGLMNPDRADIGIKSSSKGILAVPRSAVLDTGTRKLVYVEIKKGKYSPREIEVASLAGDYYPVVSGLKPGERVVISGNFLIDSQMQLAGKPSLMFPEGSSFDVHAAMGHGGASTSSGGSSGAHKNKKSKTHSATQTPLSLPYPQLGEGLGEGDKGMSHTLKIDPKVIDTIKELQQVYFSIAGKLSADNIADMAVLHKQLADKITKLKKMTDTIPKEHRPHFSMSLKALEDTIGKLNTSDIAKTRQGFKGISQAVIALSRDFYINQPGADKIYQLYCSMAPAYWLQSDKDVKNPYYGQTMIKCGELIKDWKQDNK